MNGLRLLRQRLCRLLMWSLVSALLLAGNLPLGAQLAAQERFEQIATCGPITIWSHSSTCRVYLLQQESRGWLINLGDGSCLSALPEVGITNLDGVVMTEHHREEAAGLEQLRADTRWSSTEVMTSSIEKRLLETPTEFRKWHPTLGDEFSVYGASYARPIRQGIPVDRVLADDEELSWGAVNLRALETPGHAPGGLSLELEHDGQRLIWIGGLMTDGSRMSTWFDSEWDYGFAKGVDVLMASADKLASRQPSMLFSTQGPVIESATEQLRTYRQKLETFREIYVRGYPVFDATQEQRDPISKPTAVPHLSQVSEHLYKLTDAKLGRNFAIIISDSGKGLVLDCGLLPAAMLDEMVVGMREHLGLRSIDAFWISHMHGDHFLLGPMLKEKYGAESWTLDMIADRCENPRAYDYAALVSAYGDGFDGMKIDRRFKDGEVFEWEGFRLQMDWMPGQTEFGCCLWLELDGQRVAFTGDNLFGSPSDPEQDGHEAVVARNSAILAEGYVYGSRYLKELKPDLIMGSHSFVMPDPEAFLERYHAWSLRMVSHFEQLLPDEDYEYLFDPYWVSAYPYRVDLSQAESAVVRISVRNFRDQSQTHRVRLVLPEGMTAEPSELVGEIAAGERASYEVQLIVDRSVFSSELAIVPLDITLDSKHYGQWFDFLLRTKEVD